MASPALLLPPKLAIYSCKPWIYIILKALNFFCGIKYEFRGVENIPKNQQIVFMSKHHSTLDTLLLAYVIKKPVYVLKKELLWIPFLGLYLIATKMITIDRKSYAVAFKRMVKQVRERLLRDQSNIIIFPEGGRVRIKEDVKYQRGISIIYHDKNLHDIDFVPVGINCGLFWPFGIFDKKKPGKAIISFLPAIDKSLSKSEFMHLLKSVIDTESNKLIEEGANEIETKRFLSQFKKDLS